MDLKLISAEMENADVLVGILVGYNIHIGTGIRWGEDVHTVYSVYVHCTVGDWGLFLWMDCLFL